MLNRVPAEHDPRSCAPVTQNSSAPHATLTSPALALQKDPAGQDTFSELRTLAPVQSQPVSHTTCAVAVGQ
jgi:hypothetical protein